MRKIINVEDKYQEITFRYLYNQDIGYDKVMFFFHGFNGNRYAIDIEWIERISEKGYLLVILDAENHGDRISDEYKKLDNSNRQKLIIETEINTANDAKKVYFHLLEKDIINKDMSLAVMGVSMGGAIALYLTTIFKKIQILVSLIGSPSFVEFYKYKQKVYKFENNQEYKKRLDKYAKIDPLLNYHLFSGRKILLTGGSRDKIVPMIYAEELSKKIDATFIVYDLEHEVSKQMMEDVYKFI
ncbi:MAG: acyl-CoA thioester hydrolase/BAAT C-terminal domain-containing protein [Candidatus Izemoplasmatales bacterium]|jgi:cephalosporin-C deacetylase-like acetyl esterase|nr:acyl-CoA thioester hydrolase/BAAT C-terminal domain-containing protein [Candidatus Izemoplasmatales bacterium]